MRLDHFGSSIREMSAFAAAIEHDLFFARRDVEGPDLSVFSSPSI